jgi:hypothetical protein
MPPKKKQRKFPKPSAEPIQYPYVSSIKVKRSVPDDTINDMYASHLLVPDDFDKSYIPDVKMKPLTKFYRPHFSPHFSSWIIDLVFAGKTKVYLFILNENTRYLVVYPIKDKSEEAVYPALMTFINTHPSDYPFHFKGDGEPSFASTAVKMKPMKNVFFHLRPPSYINGYQMTNSYNLMDAVVRTIRNLVGRVSQYNPKAFANHQITATVIDTYNSTVHSAFKNKFTPTDMQNNQLLEAEYISACQQRADEVDDKRLNAGLLTYEKGSILLIHLPLEKTPYGMQKRRRNFDELAVFDSYQSGNVVCDLLHPYPTLKRVIIPVYYTKYLAKDLDELNQKYDKSFIIKG